MNQHTPPSRPWEPISIEAEQALLGAILLNNDALTRVSDIIEPQHFSESLHGHLFEVLTTLIGAGKLANPITVQTFLPMQIEGMDLSVGQYVARLAAESTTIINAPDYARHIRELADRREIGNIAMQMTPLGPTEAAQLAAEAIEQLDGIVSKASTALPQVDMDTAMTQAVDAIAKAYQNDNKIIGIPTGLADVDHKTGGFTRGNLVILAGRPGMGKSAALIAMLRQSAKRDFKSLMASLEMSSEELAQRMISDALFDMNCENVPYSNLRTGSFHERLFPLIIEAATSNRALPIKVEEQPYLTMSQIATRARRMKRKGGLDILAIDHLDLVKPSGRYQGNKVYELGEITAACKALAKELDIVVILLCQLSRDVEKREDKRPILADLRSSGSIEQDADTVIFLYRPAYYLQNTEPAAGTPEFLKWQEDMAAAHNKLFAIIAKQRMGPTGTIELFCDIGSNAVRDLNHGRM